MPAGGEPGRAERGEGAARATGGACDDAGPAAGKLAGDAPSEEGGESGTKVRTDGVTEKETRGADVGGGDGMGDDEGGGPGRLGALRPGEPPGRFGASPVSQADQRGSVGVAGSSNRRVAGSRRAGPWKGQVANGGGSAAQSRHKP